MQHQWWCWAILQDRIVHDTTRNRRTTSSWLVALARSRARVLKAESALPPMLECSKEGKEIYKEAHDMYTRAIEIDDPFIHGYFHHRAETAFNWQVRHNKKFKIYMRI